MWRHWSLPVTMRQRRALSAWWVFLECQGKAMACSSEQQLLKRRHQKRPWGTIHLSNSFLATYSAQRWKCLAISSFSPTSHFLPIIHALWHCWTCLNQYSPKEHLRRALCLFFMSFSPSGSRFCFCLLGCFGSLVFFVFLIFLLTCDLAYLPRQETHLAL